MLHLMTNFKPVNDEFQACFDADQSRDTQTHTWKTQWVLLGEST